MAHPDFEYIGSPITKLIEECGELIQVLCKADRFGLYNNHPDRPGKTNLDEIKKEMADVQKSYKWFISKIEPPEKEKINGSK